MEILTDWVTGRSPTQLRPRAWVLGLSAQRLRVRAWWLNGGLMYSRALATLLLRLDAVRCALYAVRCTLYADRRYSRRTRLQEEENLEKRDMVNMFSRDLQAKPP